MTSPALIHAAVLTLAAGTGLGFLAIRRQAPGPLAAARLLGGLAAILLVAVLVRRGISLDKPPLVARFDTHVIVSLLLILAALGLDLLRSLPILTIGALPLALASMILAAATGEPGPGDPGPPFAATPMAGMHAALILCSYVAFGVAFVTALLFLIEQRQLKAHDPPAIGMLPSLETSYRLTRHALFAGVVLLTGGILAGYLYAREKLPQPGWRTDAKILVTSGMWAAFLAVALLSAMPSFKGRRTAVASAFCFVASMAASWIASFWSGFHHH